MVAYRRAAGPPHIPPRPFSEIEQQTEGHCWYCGLTPGQCDFPLLYDHAFPHDRDTPLVPSCHRYNSSKGARTPEAYRQMLLRGTPYARSTPELPQPTRPTFWFERVGLLETPLGQRVLRHTARHRKD